MENKLTLEHLAIAFANNQKVLYFDDERELQQICKIVELREDEMTISNGEYQYDVSFDDVKLVALPLSDLTKEIEVDGGKIVPIVQLLKKISLCDLSNCKFEYGFDDNEYWVNAYVNDSYSKLCDSLIFDGNIFNVLNNDEGYSLLNPQHEALDVLSKYHFDWKYNLIPKGLAIDINNLKE